MPGNFRQFPYEKVSECNTAPNDNGNELNEDSVKLEQDVGKHNSGHPSAMDGEHENRHAMNTNNNDHHVGVDMDNSG